MAFNIGDTVGDYEIVGILGAGGMGKVYKVRNTISDRIEAMKVLLPDLANEPELADRFMREIKLLASLNHPNIAALHTALRIDNQLVMIMEFVEGQTLEDRLKSGEGRLPLGEAADAIIQVLSALAYAHERNVVHRDIKPANMMQTAGGSVKLMDFGIAKAVADRRLTMTGTTLGSLYYMSPEQVKGSAQLDGRSDLYSVGVSFYELVTGTRPFKGDSDYSLMVAHLEQQPKPPIEIDPALPPDLNEIIMTAIQKDPNNRFQTAQAFRGALESIRPMLGNAAPAPLAAAAAAPASLPTAPSMAGSMPQPAPVMATPRQSAPAPQQPAAAYAPPPGPFQTAAPMPPPPPAPASRSHRGLWIALGALMVVAVLAVAALQLPRFFGTQASSLLSFGNKADDAQPEQSVPAAEAAPAQQQGGAAQETRPASTVGEPAASAPDSPAAAPERMPVSASGTAASRPVRRVTAAPPAAAAASAAAESQTPAAPAYSAPAAPAAPQEPAVDRAALDAARQRLRMLSSRASSASRTLKNIESQQQSSGVGLRGDISAAWDRMNESLEDARQALQNNDLEEARRSLDQAERDLDRIDKFLGR